MTSRKPSAEFVSLWQRPNLDERAAQAQEQAVNMEALRDSARREGFEQGRQEAFEQAAAEIAVQQQTLDQLVQALQQPFHALNEQVAEELLHLAVKIARCLLRRELRTEPEAIMALVRDTVAALNSTSRDINIHLHPEDARLLRGLAHLRGPDQSWNAIEDPLVARGDCKVSCRDALVDGRLDARINQMIVQVLGDERAGARLANEGAQSESHEEQAQGSRAQPGVGAPA